LLILSRDQLHMQLLTMPAGANFWTTSNLASKLIAGSSAQFTHLAPAET
jgi:hypothetical protein